ncbi:MAG TPA: CinA family nicotinamide mononucleotide deamidase-related protein [Flavobacterium sp.]|jgi:nicotinamide-nucleotide amidase|uniref:CinA family nicotinamide mononucleotide deamidase-related protein n=1 Tax=Flavobacterium sp. TaxID=239 RepID=UPI002C6AAB2C|nr:CinA family nicotinamide mononucleotide deamidase-related protein [Flavobacterium sp.]MCA0347984.1 CinA family nicotinamide mononucleotide deamidase-related protein [Bacteroidota bacterium]HPW96980.1 CinA family nicotinamide mononucleotide deamidase-related protein [Flavobacterium sp.]HQA73108.1 CinA family nicotinamide mononucleotide deamidase-related protein [Flavobacterium sp.]
MKATIVTIGDEILIGQIIDSNSSYIAKSLDKIGVQTHEMLSISDDKKHILDTFLNLQNKVDFVIITGGLGPTKDDITKKTFCDYFEDELVENVQVFNHVKELIEGFYKRPITQLNRDQALVPSKCEVLFNKMGTAPGMWMKKDKTVFISLPGVPYEMKYLIENEIVPKIVKEYKRPFILHKTILTYGQGESLVAERIENWENNLPEFIKLAYLPSPGRVRLRLTARGERKEILQKGIEENVNTLTKIINDIIVGFDEDETIEVVLGKLLTQQKRTLATAESCTGGKIAQMITSVSGASNYFRGGVVTYATDTKITQLNVNPETIKKHTVVSAAVAKEMVIGIQKTMNSDYAIATTGNAGPSKGDSEAEIGTVFIAISTPKKVIVEEFNFGQPREKVIDRAVNKSFELLQKEILKNV